MAFNYSKLRGRIIEKYGSQSEFAKALGISQQQLSLKLVNKTRFTQNDIVEITNLLEIEPDEVGVYFFTLEV